MLLTKKVSIQGEWAKARQDINDGDIITIADEGREIEGDYGMRQVFKVKVGNGVEKLLSFNQTTINNLIDVFDKDTKLWIGKEVKVWIVKSNVAGKIRDVIYLAAPDWQLGEMGFYNPNKDNKTPSFEEELNIENIPL